MNRIKPAAAFRKQCAFHFPVKPFPGGIGQLPVPYALVVIRQLAGAGKLQGPAGSGAAQKRQKGLVHAIYPQGGRPIREGGTGSQPEGPSGWQRSKRRSDMPKPRASP